MDNTQKLINHALTVINQKYSHLAYHNINHTKFVIKAAGLLATAAHHNGKVSSQIIPLVKLAAAFHDIEHSLGPVKNEQASANIAAAQMSDSGVYTDLDIKLVKKSILATIVTDYNLLTQSADDNYYAKIIADADIASFGCNFDEYINHANNYYRELYPEQDLTGNNYLKYLYLQQEILSKHSFYTPEANAIFKYKPTNLKRINKLIENYKVK